ncbi:AraC-type DNA-binding protein [Flexibacter flexilis DSM 6793]|uniref:AraC-type DNA-binding protein n=1 Tax=Flexibacter flexilis DSM 6793 TaxID=927664 RepID=A0A1I1LGY0_9BACT|nr:response regulator transcription factor [Flexibacter flexilis]SFC68760.1 AraC-type DNA-binding protein [Flexibacter flexilis DSM 6793]
MSQSPQPFRVKTISEFHRLKGLPPPENPLISVIDYGAIACKEEVNAQNWVFDFYQISVKRGINAKLKYGQQAYDFDEGVMFFISPNQIFGIEPNRLPVPKRSGWMLLIHPDFLWNSSLAKNIKNYDYFGYSVNEALFLSEKEEGILQAIVQNIQQECQTNTDKFSQNIIVSHIETLLNYSERFYQRQFFTRKKSNHQILERLENLLNNRLNDNYLINHGLPNVQSIADELNMSPNYLSAVLKTLTGQSTQQHIHEKIIEKAKEMLSTTHLSVNEIAFQLGFEHSQSFNKLFKNKTEMSPLEFRAKFN